MKKTGLSRQFLKEALNCPDKKLVECARKIDAYNLTASSRAFLSRDMTSGNGFAATFLLSAFVPVVDGKNLKETPMRSFRTGRYKTCSIITGFTSQDGTSLIPFSYGAVDDSKVPKTPNPKNNIKQIITYPLLANFLKNYYSFFPTWPYKLDEIILNSILNEYTKLTHKNFDDSRLVKSNYFYTLSKILSDETYICPAFKLANYIENKVKVYLYAYNYRISTNRMPFWYGIVHGEELGEFFLESFGENF
jgi:carboxylesterase type B